MKKILLIDGNSLANRAYYALGFLSDPKGRPTGAVFGFINILVKMIVEEHPDGIIVAFDHARKTFRNQLFDAYKGTRKETPADLIAQFPMIKDLLKTMGITIIEEDGIEADDIIGTVAKNLDGKKIILSGDRDLLQLISSDTEVWLTKKGVSVVDKLDLDNLKLTFNIEPYQVIELKALMGDSSDNIPGVMGIGEKTAKKLIAEYSSLDGVYENIYSLPIKMRQKLDENKDMAYLSRTLATIKTDADLSVDINENSYKFPFSQEVKTAFEELGFGSLLKRGELFEKTVIVDKKNRKLISSEQDLSELISHIDGEFAYNLEKMEFSVTSGEIYYLSPVIDMFSSSLSLDEVLLQLKPTFENPNITKLTCAIKDDYHALSRLGIILENAFDLTLANYLVHAGESVKQNYDNCDEYFSNKTTLISQLENMQLDKLYFDLELPLSKVLFDMEEEGFKIDIPSLTLLSKQFNEKLESLTSQIYETAGHEFNINSPKQVASVLFDELGLVAYNNKSRSTGIDVLMELKDVHPIVEKIIEYRKFQKLNSTYVDVYMRLAEQKGDIIHTRFNQALTNTGRISSSDPNLQNIPTNDEEGKALRKIFISKFEGGSLISADYNQIELRLLADMSGEEKLIDIYNRGEDIHTATACHIFAVQPEEVTQKMRREAKAVNFGIIYGISDYGLSQSIKVSRKNAKDYIDSYFARYPKVKQFSQDNIEFAKEHGFIRTKFGRIRHIPEIKASNYLTRSFGERVAMNMPLQGTASDIIKMSMLKVASAIKEEGLKSRLILQIHDELVLDVYPGEEKIAENLLRKCMQEWLNLSVSLPVSINMGKNLLECK